MVSCEYNVLWNQTTKPELKESISSSLFLGNLLMRDGSSPLHKKLYSNPFFMFPLRKQNPVHQASVLSVDVLTKKFESFVFQLENSNLLFPGEVFRDYIDFSKTAGADRAARQ